MATSGKKVDQALKIGDFVTFNNSKYGGMLSAEGILLPDLTLNANLSTLDDALFSIHLQRQYSASREYDDYMKSTEGSAADAEAGSNQKFVDALLKGRDNETKLNNDYMSKRVGEAVRFGDIIQLFHCKSGKYTTVEANILAKSERENMSVALDSNGNSYSWLVVMPRFKIDREGDIVQDASEMYLKVSERLNEFIHCAERYAVGHDREINCSLEQTPWRMNIFQSATDAQQEALVLASQLVYINDPETLANMAIVEQEMDQLDPDVEVRDDETYNSDDDEDASADYGKADDNTHDYGSLVLRPQISGAPVDSRALWALELKAITMGGPIFWRTSQVKIKNVCTGVYLDSQPSYEIDDDGDVVEKYMLNTTTDGSSLGASWSITDPNSTSKTLQNAKAYQINSNGVYFERGEERDDKTYVLKGTKEKSTALSLLIHKYTEEGSEGDSTSVEPLDVHVAMAGQNYLSKYHDMTVIPSNATTSTLWPSAVGSDLATLKMIIERLVNFSQGFPISATNVVIGVDKNDPIIKLRRQNLLREQKILDILLAIIFKLKPVSERAEKAANATKTNPVHFTDEERAVLSMGMIILELSFTLLYYCIVENAANQIYIADNLPVILAHLSSQQLAGKCVTEMLSKNEELQETKITAREIAIFVDKLRNSKMNPMYLQLLQACCSCVGKGVDGNQCKVADMIFENTNDIIIQINADYTKISPATWESTNSQLYIPDAPVPGSPIMGEGLLYTGLPRLSLSWTTNSIDFSPLGLFGKLSVNVLELYAADKRFGKKKGAGVDQKEMVADYFISQIYLGAEMCMDRNYVAMHKMDSLFSFDVIATLMKIPVSDKLKAAAARLMLCLYVDRDPQADSKIPVLTRTWSEVVKHKGEPKLPFVEPQRRYVFALAQQMLSEHVEFMANRRWTDLSKRMLHLLRMMVSFKFYGSFERMQDVVKPLITAIDRRKVNFSKSAAPKEGGADSANQKKPEPAASNSMKTSKVVPVDSSASKYAANDNGEETKEDENDDSWEDDDEELEKTALLENTWQGKVLTFMDGLPWLLFILSLVAVAVGQTVNSTITGVESVEGEFGWAVGMFIFAVFVYDLVLRTYVYKYIHGEVSSFFSQPFNQIDVAVVLIDVIFLLLPSGDEAVPGEAEDGSGGEQYAKALRMVRMVRLMRILRAAKVISAIVDHVQGDVLVYQEPARFARAPMHELETMSEIVDILLYAQTVMQDRALSIFLNKFRDWESGDDTRSAPAIFMEVCEKSSELTLAVNDFDNIFIDAVMFKYTPLVQGALDLLMFRYSSVKLLIDNVKLTQLLVSPKRERQFRLIDQMLQQLERNAETHELWGELVTDADYAMNKQTKDILKELGELCRRKTFAFNGSGAHFIPEVEIQNLLRNLGCYSICLKVVDLNGGVEYDEETNELDDVGENTRDLCRLCNELMYWYALDNSKNQEQVYGSLDYLMDSLDDEINSDACVRAVFSNNEYLMKFVPHVYLAKQVDKIIAGGKCPQYLSLCVSITNVGDRNVVENQFEIVRLLTSPGRLQKVGSFLVPVNHPEYQRKRNMMIDLDPEKEYTLAELPPELAYHLALLEVLAACTAGRIAISSIEAKIQSVFSYIDCIEAILDPACCLIAKLTTSSFLLNAIIEVELVVPGLGQSKCCWRLITSYVHVLSPMVDDLQRIDANGWDAPGVSRQNLDYQLHCIMILSIFFEKNYTPDMFTNEVNSTEGQLDRVSMTQSQASNIIKALYKHVRAVHQLNSVRLTDRHKEYIIAAVKFMNSSVPGMIEPDLLENIAAEEAAYSEEAKLASPEHSDSSIEKRLHDRYTDFLKEIEEDADVTEMNDTENDTFISYIEELPFVRDSSDIEIRYEPFIKKLVQHVRENIVIIDNETRIDERCTKTTLWCIKSFRRMIENKMGMDIYQRDDEGGEEQDIAAEPVVTAFNTMGVTELCLDLIADGVDEDLQDECIKLCVGLLFKEGGNRSVQQLMYDYLSRPEAELFFHQVRAIIKKLADWHDWEGVVELEEGEEPNIPTSIMLIRMLQLMAEGHFHPNQEIMREQPNSPSSVNLLDDMVSYLKCLSQIHCRTSTVASIRVASTILEVLQGPCRGNQEHVALSTDLLEVLNRVIRATVIRDLEREEVIELKKIAMDIVGGILEAQSLKSPLYERVLSVLHVDAIKTIALGDENGVQEEEITEDFELLQTECLVLLQMLIEYHPPLRGELDIPEDITDGHTTTSVEILWDGEMNRVFFHVPEVCHLLSKSSKDELVENVVRDSQELKLIDFMERARVLYREVVHQRTLVEAGIATVFSRTNMANITWLAFALALTQNVLFLGYYDRRYIGDEVDDISWVITDGVPIMPDNIVNVVKYLNYTQIACASFVNVMMFVVRAPVIYQGLEESNENYTKVEVYLYTLLDPLTMYYILYNLIAVLALTTADYYATFLLMDIVVKNSTAQNVLMSIVAPRWNIIMALVITTFISYCYAWYIFIYFPTDVLDGSYFCETLWGCTKFVINYGVKAGEGVGEEMMHQVAQRWLLDMTHFFAVTVGVFNLVAGVIITTFGRLREEKEERVANTEGVCFICGIEKHIFDRAANDPNGFKEHITEDHNMWSYLNFIFFIWEQDKDDDNGLEYFVRYAIEDDNLDWIPSNKAMRLDQAASEEEALQEELRGKMSLTENNVFGRISKLEANLEVVLEQLTQTLKKDHKVIEEDDKAATAVDIMKTPTKSNPGEVSAPSSAWNVHRRLSPPYQRAEPGSTGLDLPFELGGAEDFGGARPGSPSKLDGVMEGEVLDMMGTVTAADDYDAKVRNAPTEYQQASRWEAVKHAYVEVFLARGVSIVPSQVDETIVNLLRNGVIVGHVNAVGAKDDAIFFQTLKTKVASDLRQKDEKVKFALQIVVGGTKSSEIALDLNEIKYMDGTMIQKAFTISTDLGSEAKQDSSGCYLLFRPYIVSHFD